MRKIVCECKTCCNYKSYTDGTIAKYECVIMRRDMGPDGYCSLYCPDSDTGSNVDKIELTAIDRLDEIANSNDREGAHYEADQVLCDVLTELGLDSLVNHYHYVVDKWYA